MPYFAAKVNGNFSGNRERFGLPTIQGVIVLADLNNGTPLAIMDAIEITMMRTGAATAVAAKYLSRDDPSVVTIVGCGLQGRVQLRSLAAVRRIIEVHAYDIRAGAARAFALEMAPVIGAPILPCADVRAALVRSDIVVTCTTARRPIVYRDDIAPGAFVAAVGADNPDKQEIDPALLASAHVVVDVLINRLRSATSTMRSPPVPCNAATCTPNSEKSSSAGSQPGSRRVTLSCSTVLEWHSRTSWLRPWSTSVPRIIEWVS